jgi:LPS sulfotransferase NodH
MPAAPSHHLIKSSPLSRGAEEKKTLMKRPVFILGSPRSGTTLLYHMLLSAGGFAVYRSESKVFDLLAPRFGDLRRAKNKLKMLDLWFQTRMFGISEVNPESLRTKILADCNNAGDFLRIFMEEIAVAQNVDRWAECTPEHLQYLSRIRREVPDALFVHIIRDGRDVALSLQKQGWVQPFRWDRQKNLLVAGLFWEWMVRKGRRFGRSLGADYEEVHYEDLLADPRSTLARIGGFIDHDLDYDRIQRVAIGSVSEPNTSFRSEVQASFRPVGRWRDVFPSKELAAFECLVGAFLRELNYALAAHNLAENVAALKRMRTLYRLFWNAKLAIKVNTPLGRILMRTAPSEL